MLGEGDAWADAAAAGDERRGEKMKSADGTERRHLRDSPCAEHPVVAQHGVRKVGGFSVGVVIAEVPVGLCRRAEVFVSAPESEKKRAKIPR